MLRRDFLKTCTLLALPGCAAFSLPFKQRQVKKFWVQPFEDHKDQRFGILFINLTNGEVETVTTKFNVHSLYFDSNRQELIGVNKYGPEYLRVKVASFQNIGYFRVGAGINLSGHVASHEKASEFFFTAIDKDSGENAIVGIDKESGLESARVKFGRSSPPVHDCRVSADKKSILATSGAALHSLELLERGLKIRKLTLSTKGASVRHFAQNSRGDICLQANIIHLGENYSYQSAEVVFLTNNSEQKQLIAPLAQELRDAELLDFCFSRSGEQFACIHGGTRQLSLWSSRPFAHQAFMTLPEEIVRVQDTNSPNHFLVLGRKNFYLVDARNQSYELRAGISSGLRMSYSYGHRTVIAV